MRKWFTKQRIRIAISSCALILVATIGAFASDQFDVRGIYELDSLSQLKIKLNELDKKDLLTQERTESVIASAEPKVAKAFVNEKKEILIQKLNAIDPDAVMVEADNGKLEGKQIIDLGDGCEAEIILEDGEDLSSIAKLLNFTIDPCYAATNGEQLWKDYGNRYFTAKVTSFLGAGICTMRLENHYKLSSKGIDIRYGISDAAGASYTSDIVALEPVVTDWSARTVGASDVNMYCKYQVSGAGGGNFRINSTVGFVDIDKSKEKIKVKHSWTAY